MTRSMIDFAFPVSPPQVMTDIVFIYAGGDTPHVFTDAEIEAQPARYRMPGWVRSDPQSVDPTSDANDFITWLKAHKVPTGVCVALDLETAIDTTYVNAFNSALMIAGYKLIKYGSLSTIFDNPKTSGGTWVADPTGNPHMDTEGDTVATQWVFANGYDLSEVLDNTQLPLWDTHAPAETAFPTPVFEPPLVNIKIPWAPVANARSYHFQLIRLSDEHVLFDASIPDSSYTATNLATGQKYAYRVAVHATGNILASHWSSWMPLSL